MSAKCTGVIDWSVCDMFTKALTATEVVHTGANSMRQ